MEADTPKTILIFLINGVNSLLGWNAAKVYQQALAIMGNEIDGN
jgi:membrane-bound lytic murein transglycosylase B